MSDSVATAVAHPNIAFIKYWGNRDDSLRLPANGSISMNLGALETRTTVAFSSAYRSDRVSVNGSLSEGESLIRVVHFMDHIRSLAGEKRFAEIESRNNFPIGAGIASSAAAFAALALAGSAAAGLRLNETELSRLARLGSGSACRSIPPGFCEWLAGDSDEESIAVSIAPPDYWALTDIIAVVSARHKEVGSSMGHQRAMTSPYQAIRVATAPERLLECRTAILKRDFDRLALICEKDSTMMHGVMMTQEPPLFYWEPASLKIMKNIMQWRREGIPCFFTLDAGPNVHVLCPEEVEKELKERLGKLSEVENLLSSGPGDAAHLAD